MADCSEKSVIVVGDNSSYNELPTVPLSLIDRQFALADANVEVTSLDIAPHGAFVVAGTSSGMILLFDLSNPNEQRDGMLIGQIRARGMHTNLILTVKFSEDGRFVFAGVSKGSSEMLAIDLGRVLVDWDADANPSSRTSCELVQQQQLKNLITFNFSDAKLRGFSAVARIERPANTAGATSCNSLRSSARYRLACGKGIKNVHIWHFTAGYLPQDDGVDARERPLHGKWEYVCDVASNGNTITHIEFRRGGQELLSKSAGMCIRLWELNASEVPLLRAETAAVTDESSGAADAVGTSTDVDDAPLPVLPAPGSSGFSLKPTYVDIANSQDIKCLLPVGTVAYGGTYQFAVLNTGAPKEANRDVLELPERFSGDGAVAAVSGGAVSAGRGRR
jgi:WD40 repeat protein